MPEDAEHFSNCSDGKSYKCPICSIKQEPQEYAEKLLRIGDEMSEKVNEPHDDEVHRVCGEINDDGNTKRKKCEQNDQRTPEVRDNVHYRYTRLTKPDEEIGERKRVHQITGEGKEQRFPSPEAVDFTVGKTPKSCGVKSRKPRTIRDLMNNCEDISDVSLTGTDDSVDYSFDTWISKANYKTTMPVVSDGYISDLLTEDLGMDTKPDDKLTNENNSFSSDANADMEFDDVEITSADCDYIDNITSTYSETDKDHNSKNPAKLPVSYQTISRMMGCLKVVSS